MEDAAVAQSLTIIDGRTFAPIGVAQSTVPTGIAPVITVADSTLTAVATVSGVGPVYNVAGQALVVGSTITVGSGVNAQTLALSVDGKGTTVLLSASAGTTKTLALQDTRTISSANDGSIGEAIAGGLGETRTAPDDGRRTNVGEQTRSVASRLEMKLLWRIVPIMFGVIVIS